MSENVLARPLEEQRRPIEEWLKAPADWWLGRPGSRRGLLELQALERQQWEQYHSWHRVAADEGLKVLCAEVTRSESRHALSLASVVPPGLSPLERALIAEQAALDSFAILAQEEPDANLRAGFEYLVLELLEHAYLLSQRLTALGHDPQTLTQGTLPPRRGRPLEEQHWTSFDAVKRPYDKRSVDPLSRARIQLATALCHALHDETRQILEHESDHASRELIARLRAVQADHVSFCESFFDPSETPFERAVGNEFGEVTYYRRHVEADGDHALQNLLRSHLADELAHLNLWEGELRQREGVDPWPLTHSRSGPSATAKTTAEVVAKLLPVQLQRRSKGKGYVEIGKTTEAFS